MGTTVSTDRETNLGEVKEEIKQNGTPVASLNGISEKTPTQPDSQGEGEERQYE